MGHRTNLTVLSTTSVLTMSSREIAELVESRHSPHSGRLLTMEVSRDGVAAKLLSAAALA